MSTQPYHPDDEFWCDEIDDDACFTCGGSGVIEDECTCMDDTCCCLYPRPPTCPECKGRG